MQYRCLLALPNSHAIITTKWWLALGFEAGSEITLEVIKRKGTLDQGGKQIQGGNRYKKTVKTNPRWKQIQGNPSLPYALNDKVEF